MPIIQISEILHRRGTKNTLVNLNEGEIGLTLDTAEVFIGTPNFPRASIRSQQNQYPFANTQLLTEFSDNTERLINYTYRYRQETGPLNGSASPLSANTQRIIRYLQERLDEVVSVKSYGAKGNGFITFPSVAALRSAMTASDPQAIAKETYAIRRAALDVANTINNSSVVDGWAKRALYFPAGVYVIEDYAVLPPYSTWIGDGKGKTIILMAPPTPTNKIPVVQTISGAATLAALDNNTLGNFIEQNILSYCTNILVCGITFLNVWNDDPARLYRIRDSLFYDCEFANLVRDNKSSGNWSNDDCISVIIDPISTGGYLAPTNVYFEGCSFVNSTYGIFATGDSDNIVFDNCTFTGNYRAIRIGETALLSRTSSPTLLTATGPIRGPSGYRVTNSLIQNCYAEAFSVITPNGSFSNILQNYQKVGGFHVSLGNRYENCGHGNRDFPANPLSMGPSLYPVIRFGPDTVYNVSAMDTFDRNEPPTSIATSRVYFSPEDSNIILNVQDPPFFPIKIPQPNTYPRIRNIAASQTLPTQFSPSIIFNLNNSAVFIDYSYTVGSVTRIGTLQIVDNGTITNLSDNSTIIGGPDPVTLQAINISPTTYAIHYTNSAAVPGVFKFTIRSWVTV